MTRLHVVQEIVPQCCGLADLPKVHISLPKQAHDLFCTASLLH